MHTDQNRLPPVFHTCLDIDPGLRAGDSAPYLDRETSRIGAEGSRFAARFRDWGRLLAAATAVFGVAVAMTVAAQPSAATARAGARARVLLVTGIDYPGHVWRQTAPALAALLAKDPRLEVFTVEDPAFLDSAALDKYDAVFLHFMNWEQAGPGARARENLRRFVASGKGLVLAHFACGAWTGEWPEFAQLAGRVWAGKDVRQHDPRGVFRVELSRPDHPIARGLSAFEADDELYTCLAGDHPIEVVAEAKSKVDGKAYPMAFVSQYERGRTFHCVLGHDVKALSAPGVQELFRRGCAWAAGLSPVAATAPETSK